MNRPLRIHVCIDQPLRDEQASGLVRSWVHFWGEAARHDDLDVTGHTVGDRRRTRVVAPNVRVREHPSFLSPTRWLDSLGLETPTQVGLFPYHPTLAAELARADVLHTTYTYLSFAMTALAVSRRRRIPLVNSLQTHVPLHSEIYAHRFAELVFGRTPLRGLLVDRRGFARPLRAGFERQLRWYLARCNRVLVSAPADAARVPGGMPTDRVSLLGRGIDKGRFHPGRRDRRWLRERFGVAEDEPVVLFVGRIMPEKNVLTLARALARLREGGERFTLLLCGRGSQQEEVARLLGDRAVLAGVQPHDALGRIYASCDVFAFPSTTEMYANVVVEAMCSGVPPVVSGREGASQHVDRPGENGLVVDADEPGPWAEAIRRLLGDRSLRRRMGAAARARIERDYGGWGEVFDRVLKPAWLAAAAEGRPPRRPWS
ncbi:MAG: hypothetical protein Kow0092_38130 [Deferrisomatales bacterium]